MRVDAVHEISHAAEPITGTVELEAGVVTENVPVLQQAPVEALPLLDEQFTIGGSNTARRTMTASVGVMG
ncbi:hypothetical protein Y013_24980 (plasmid) [Rhodococcus pyridinivorans SB3094]|uniref:Uncharacterized protein n=1 Tax=Rhodococcus pyridinivorans SB3094 TaxID=1435356 RepID=V9XQG7_9NOCA|nr:hypothetical protein [Rhodococcus pyridinivorans]AHD24245.1 hypothetical protein Y013_24980 [Rhodococcus pyridinivorans SB3094]